LWLGLDETCVGLRHYLSPQRFHLVSHGLKPSRSRFNRLDGMSFHHREPTLIVIQQQTLLSEFLQQCFYLRILELEDLLLTLIDHATECSEQNVPELGVQRRKSSVSAADR
jgi:hypothetical protein